MVGVVGRSVLREARMSKPRWIRFEGTGKSESGKTRTWDVRSTSELGGHVVKKGHHLGTVQWLGAWRQYVFVPLLRDEDDGLFNEYVYNPACLREIADFVEAKTKEHRAARAAEKEKQ